MSEKKWINSFEGDSLYYLGHIIKAGRHIRFKSSSDIFVSNGRGCDVVFSGLIEWFVATEYDEGFAGVLVVLIDNIPETMPAIFHIDAITEIYEVDHVAS